METKITKKQEKAVIKSYIESIQKDLRTYGKVRIPELGIFKVKTKKARKARKGVNPFTGQPMTFKAKPKSKVIKFRPAKGLKTIVQKRK